MTHGITVVIDALKPFVIGPVSPIGQSPQMSDSEGTIRQQRFRLFLEQMIGSGVSQRVIAEKLGVAQAFISQVVKGDRLAGEQTMDMAKREYSIHEDFFSETDLDGLSFRAFVGSSPFRQTVRVSRDADLSLLDPVVTEFVKSLEGTSGALDERRIRMLVTDVDRYGGKPTWNELSLVLARINARIEAEERAEPVKKERPIKHRDELPKKRQ